MNNDGTGLRERHIEALREMLDGRGPGASFTRKQGRAALTAAIAALSAVAPPPVLEGVVDREQVLQDYVADYEYLGETEDGCDACYQPNERERLLIEDAIRGWDSLELPAASPAAPAQPEGGEAVAWMIRYSDGARIAVFEHPAPAMFEACKATITPLYTRPASAQPEDGASVVARIQTTPDGRSGLEPTWIEVSALAVGQFFAVHADVTYYPQIDRTELADGGRFGVTHLPSGMNVAKSPTMEGAVQAAKAMAEIAIDWANLRRDDVVKLPKELRVQIDVIRAAASADGDIFTKADNMDEAAAIACNAAASAADAQEQPR